MAAMGKTQDRLDSELEAFLLSQRVFFVATAPLSASGHVNVSPKGLDSLRVLSPKTVAYVDYPGSGVETIAHLRENGRIVLMVCAFEGAPRVLRIHGKARAVEPQDPEFDGLLERFEPRLVVRSIIVIECERVSTSCGYGVPLFEYRAEREQLPLWAERKGERIPEYERQKNAESVDGLPGLRWITDSRGG
jgi:hypothetical protein